VEENVFLMCIFFLQINPFYKEIQKYENELTSQLFVSMTNGHRPIIHW